MAGKKNSLTEGSVGKGVLLFALPLLGSSLIQQMYSTVDLIFVGQLLGTEASAAVGATGLLVTCLVGFFNGMAVGASVMAAQHFGGKNFHHLKKLIRTIVWMGIIGGFLLMILGEIFAPIFLRWMGTPAEIFDLAVSYLRIYLFSMISIVTYNLCSGAVRSMGDSKSPMLFQLAGCIINVFANYIFVVIFKLGVQGTAWATFMSQTFAAICVIVYLYRMKASYNLRFHIRDFNKRECGAVMRIGVPAGLQAMVITLSNILIQSQINTLGVSSIAAFTVYFRTEMILYLPILALGQAVVSFVGQNYGAGNHKRIQKGNRICMISGIAITVFIAVLLLLFARPVLGIFTRDPEVVEITRQIMFITFPLYFLCTIIECLSSSLRGYGKAILPMVVTIVSYCGFRILALFIIMSKIRTAQGVALAYPISWSIAAVLMFVVTIRFKKESMAEKVEKG